MILLVMVEPPLCGRSSTPAGFSHGPAANSAVAARSSQGTSVAKAGLSSDSRISDPMLAPITEITPSAPALLQLWRMSAQ